MNNKWLKAVSTMAVTTVAGLVLVSNNARADTTSAAPISQQLTVNNQTPANTATSLNLYSNNLAQVQVVQAINFPAGYTLDAVRNVNSQAAADAFEQTVQQGIYNNNYQSDTAAAAQAVDLNSLTADQVSQLNQYGLNLVNRARAEFGLAPFTQNAGTINQVRALALEYQFRNESLLNGHWHDYEILQGRSENIAAHQVYVDQIPNLAARPFASAVGTDFANVNAVPLFTIKTMDDLRACVYYGLMGMLFNDAGDLFGHAQNFLTVQQPITTLALYPSLTYATGRGTWANGTPFAFRLENIDMHYIWTTGANYSQGDFGNQGTVTPDWDRTDNGNYAWLDGAFISSTGQLVATGWHATNAAQGRPYHYLIALDQNGHELQRVATHRVDRPDVQQAHNVYGAAKAGFVTQLDLATKLARVTSIRLISRYSGSMDGNSDYVDYWFAPLTVDQGNYANLDGAAVVGDQLRFSGWHASNQASGKAYHYIIILNNGREVGRRLVSAGANRPDVANVYGHIAGAGQSGFSVDFALATLNFNQRVQVLSRYTDDPAGNGNAVDYWFAPLTDGQYSNQAALDNFSVSNGRLKVAGWHANGVSRFEQHHFIILFDATTNQQVESYLVSAVARPDVQRVYPGVANAGQSGFSLDLDLAALNLVPGHRYVVISRYSSNAAGNGNGNGSQYTDYWFAPQELLSGQEAGYVDQHLLRQVGGRTALTVAGWRVTNLARGYHTLILFDNTRGRELARQTVADTPTGLARPDIMRLYGRQYLNAPHAGFTGTISLPAGWPQGDDYTIISRYTPTPDANRDYVDVFYHLGSLNFEQL
ncbi:SEC10/PgrA surface exclusion domain-containing protein [Limosilactobacillus antri]|uniref:SEC10/PgrA surface exclusion domain-containing protein n=1 Tax=Limosilactobacillus antri TaxID=227943 RepID=UPI001F5A8E10|nr:SEC10/PgrA surface exclusion domain-containing protein [Limosilactobacillus antri]